MSSVLTTQQKNAIYNPIAIERHEYHGEGWWYITGLADAKSGYGNAAKGKGTCAYECAKDEEKQAYDQGYVDGIGWGVIQ